MIINEITSNNLSVNIVDRTRVNLFCSELTILFTLYSSPSLKGKILFAI